MYIITVSARRNTMITDVIRFRAAVNQTGQNILASQQTLQRALYATLSTNGQGVETVNEVSNKSGGIKVRWQIQKANCSLTITQRKLEQHITTTFENSQGITHVYNFVDEIIIYPPGGQIMVENRMGHVMILSRDGSVKTGPKHELLEHSAKQTQKQQVQPQKLRPIPQSPSSWNNLLKDS